MPGKQVKCKHCQKTMRSDNLKRHAKVCRGPDIDSSGGSNVKSKPIYTQSIPENTRRVLPDSSIQTCSSFPDITKPVSDSNMSAIIDAIINNGIDVKPKYTDSVPPPPPSARSSEPAPVVRS